MILADTSAWIRHFKTADPILDRHLRDQRVVVCDVVAGELLLGAGFPVGAAAAFDALPHVPTLAAAETIDFVRRHAGSFRATGVGWADAQIIASAVDAGALLYSADGPQRKVWRALGFRLGG